jgi:hypothetical protein
MIYSGSSKISFLTGITITPPGFAESVKIADYGCVSVGIKVMRFLCFLRLLLQS